MKLLEFLGMDGHKGLMVLQKLVGNSLKVTNLFSIIQEEVCMKGLIMVFLVVNSEKIK